MIRSTLLITYKLARRIVIAVIGITVLLIGVAMIVLPGPAIVVIPIGLGILGAEFAWARRWLATLRRKAQGTIIVLKRKKRRYFRSRAKPDE